MIGSSYRRRAKSPLGTVLIINLLGKGLTPRACMGDGGSIWWAPGFRHSDNLMIDGVLQVLVFVLSRIPQISRLNFFVYCSCKIIKFRFEKHNLLILFCRLVAISSFSFELESSVSFEDLTALPSISFFMSAFFFSRVFTFVWLAGRSCSLLVRLSWPKRIRVIFAVHCNYF